MIVSPGMPRVLERVTPQRLELATMLAKEKRKMLCYHGSFLHHYSDRTFFYASLGAPRRSTRYIIERAHTRRQFVHPSANRDRVQIRNVRFDDARSPCLGGYARDRVTDALCTTNVMQDHVCNHVFQSLDRQQAIDLLESWGVDYVMLDEVAKPSAVDMHYHQHKLYVHKFHWSPVPETNARIGDADYAWRGEDAIDYSSYNAHTPTPRNAFRSLWRCGSRAHAPGDAGDHRPADTATSRHHTCN